MSAAGPALQDPEAQQKPSYTESYISDFIKTFAMPKEESRAAFEAFPLDKKREFSSFVKEVFAIAKAKKVSNNEAIATIVYKEACLSEIQRLEEEKQRLLAENEQRLIYYSSQFAKRICPSTPASAAVAPINYTPPKVVLSVPPPRTPRRMPQQSPHTPAATVETLTNGLSQLALDGTNASASSAGASSVLPPNNPQRSSSAAAIPTASKPTAATSAVPKGAPIRVSKPSAPAAKLQLPPLATVSLKPKASATVQVSSNSSSSASVARTPAAAQASSYSTSVSSVTTARAVTVTPSTAATATHITPPSRTLLVQASVKPAGSKPNAKPAAAQRALPQPPATCHQAMAPAPARGSSTISVPGSERSNFRP